MAKKPEQISSTEAKAAIEDKIEKAKGAGLSEDRIAELMLLAEIMKQPSAAELQKKETEEKQRLDTLLAEAEVEKARDNEIYRQQSFCSHLRKDGKLLFTGQVLSNGLAIVRCLSCQKPYVWTATEEEKKEGLNFLNPDFERARHESQLEYMEKTFPADPEKIRALGLPHVAERHAKYLKAETR